MVVEFHDSQNGTRVLVQDIRAGKVMVGVELLVQAALTELLASMR